MALSVLFGKVNDCDKPVAISPDVEDHIPVYKVGVFYSLDHFGRVVPTSSMHNRSPGLYVVGCIRILFYDFGQMSESDDMHLCSVLHKS